MNSVIHIPAIKKIYFKIYKSIISTMIPQRGLPFRHIWMNVRTAFWLVRFAVKWNRTSNHARLAGRLWVSGGRGPKRPLSTNGAGRGGGCGWKTRLPPSSGMQEIGCKKVCIFTVAAHICWKISEEIASKYFYWLHKEWVNVHVNEQFGHSEVSRPHRRQDVAYVFHCDAKWGETEPEETQKPLNTNMN